MIPLFKVKVPANIGEVVQHVFDSGIITEGVYFDAFEAALTKRFHTYTSLTNSGTSALTLAYHVSGVGPGTEVITTPMTCMATSEPIHTLGAKIVWADIDPSTGNISATSVADRITDRTRAIVGVHWSGLPFDVDGIKRVLYEKGRTDIKVIVDAAHAFGGTYKGKPVGCEADFVCFSFQAIKHLTTVDGGAVTSLNLADDQRIKRLRWFGLGRKYVGEKWSQDISEVGYKFHMNNVNAAIGLAQLEDVDAIVQAHQRNGQMYDRLITNPKVTPLRQPPQEEGTRSVYWIYTVLVDDQQAFRQHMNSHGIACDIVHFRNDRYSVFKRYESDLPGVDSFCSRMMNIPIGWWLTQSELDYIVETVNSYE